MSNEIPMISAWLYQRIVTDATLIAGYAALTPPLDITDQVWEYRAPEETPVPRIQYQRQPDSGSGDVNTLEGVRIFTRARYLIWVTATGQDWNHEDIANRLDALFGRVVNQVVTTPAGFIESCVRVEPFDLPEELGGVQYRHLGGLYEIAAQAA